MARAVVVGVLVVLLLAPIALLFPVSPASVHSMGTSYFVVVTLDWFLFLCVLIFASSRRIIWESFLHPSRGFGSIVGSLATILGIVIIEIGLGILFIIVALVSTDCSHGRSYSAGTCDLHTATAYSTDLLSGVMIVGAMAACLAFARVLILIALATNSRQSTTKT